MAGANPTQAGDSRGSQSPAWEVIETKNWRLHFQQTTISLPIPQRIQSANGFAALQALEDMEVEATSLELDTLNQAPHPPFWVLEASFNPKQQPLSPTMSLNLSHAEPSPLSIPFLFPNRANGILTPTTRAPSSSFFGVGFVSQPSQHFLSST